MPQRLKRSLVCRDAFQDVANIASVPNTRLRLTHPEPSQPELIPTAWRWTEKAVLHQISTPQYSRTVICSFQTKFLPRICVVLDGLREKVPGKCCSAWTGAPCCVWFCDALFTIAPPLLVFAGLSEALQAGWYYLNARSVMTALFSLPHGWKNGSAVFLPASSEEVMTGLFSNDG